MVAVLRWSLDSSCPIPWPTNPSYPILPPTPDLKLVKQAYHRELYSSSVGSSLKSLDSFARLLISLIVAHSHSNDANINLQSHLRSIILPLHDLNHKYSQLVQSTLQSPPGEERSSDHLPQVPGLEEHKLDPDEELALRTKWIAWDQERNNRKSATASTSAAALVKGKGTEQVGESDEEARDQSDEVDKPASWTVEDEGTLSSWIAALELFETRLQCLVLLALLSLPPPRPPPPEEESDPLDPNNPEAKKKKKKEKREKKRKNRDRERDPTTLDPELLLDFLTDRLQIWRVTREFEGLGTASSNLQGGADGGNSKNGSGLAEGKVELEKDEVHLWWEDVVEPLFSPRLATEVLAPHRLKLFPASSFTESLSTRLEPAPSPFKRKTVDFFPSTKVVDPGPWPTDRSLLSLDKSATRRRTQQAEMRVAESPTMKRLLGIGRLGAGGSGGGKSFGWDAGGAGGSQMLGGGENVGEAEEEGEDGAFFKIPTMPAKNKGKSSTTAAIASTSTLPVAPSSLDFAAAIDLSNTTTSREPLSARPIKPRSTTSREKESSNDSRKQPRSRGSASNTAGAGGLRRVGRASSTGPAALNRREVNLARPAGAVARARNAVASSSKAPAVAKGMGLVAGGEAKCGTKRKSVSPRKLPTASGIALEPSLEPFTLVPDTPVRKRPAHSTSNSNPFFQGHGHSQTQSHSQPIPSFAALGAAFRPGAAAPVGFPQPSTAPAGTHAGAGIGGAFFSSLEREQGMDWETTGNRDSDFAGWNGDVMGTPVQRRTEVFVPDT
ncbi:hypothetical protein T439DRAFT_376047 [Meredithblackwellia eburnea MCA 4105]